MELEMYKKALVDWENPKGKNGKENFTDDGFCDYFEAVFGLDVHRDNKFKKQLPELYKQKTVAKGSYHYPEEDYRTDKWCEDRANALRNAIKILENGVN